MKIPNISQPIPSSIREDIKAKLSLAVPVEDIYSDIRAGFSSRENREKATVNVTRAHLIQKSSISSMKRKLTQKKRLYPDDSESTRLLVENISGSEEFSPFIVYKPQGQDVVIGPKIYNDLDVKKDLFVIQTKPQLEMFIKGMEKVICIDSTHKTINFL